MRLLWFALDDAAHASNTNKNKQMQCAAEVLT
jgi:hypothetical protein